MGLILLVMLVAILVSLGIGLKALLGRGPDSGDRLLHALTWRIALSVAVFLLLLLGWMTGVIEPHGLAG